MFAKNTQEIGIGALRPSPLIWKAVQDDVAYTAMAGIKE